MSSEFIDAERAAWVVRLLLEPGNFLTGQERDSESGLDYFIARHYASTLGRFNSPDPGNFGAFDYLPQSWNGYEYALNNPVSFTNPRGLKFCAATKDEDGNIVVDESDCISDEECDKNPKSCGGRVHVIDEPEIVEVTAEEEGQSTVGCGIDLPCHFFVGFGNLVFNEDPRGALRLGGAVTIGALLELPAVIYGGASLTTLSLTKS